MQQIQKNQGMKISYIGSIGFCKKLFLKDWLRFCFKNPFRLLLKFSFLLTKVLLFLKMEPILR